MLADQFHEAAAAAKNTYAADQVARLVWRAHAEGQLADAEAEAIGEALAARSTSTRSPRWPASAALWSRTSGRVMRVDSILA